MADDETEANEDYPSEHLKRGSNQVSGGLLQLSSGIENIFKSIWTWFGDNPALKWLVLLPIGTALGNYLVEKALNLYVYYFGQNVVASTDIQVQTFPLPLGLSVRILFISWFLSITIIFIKFVELRKRVEQLEKGNEG